MAISSRCSFCSSCGASRGDSSVVFVRKSIDARLSETGAQAMSDWKARRRKQMGPLTDEELIAISGSPALAEFKKIFRAMTDSIPKIIALVSGLLGVVAIVWFVNSEKRVVFEVSAHSWERKVPIEQYLTVDESEWCGLVPAHGRIHDRRKEIHHYDKIADGEDCHDVPGSCTETCVNVDNGNGSFSEVCTESCSPSHRECKTRYRNEPVYELKCYYEIERWKVRRTFDAKGKQRQPAPHWPQLPQISTCAKAEVGCERIGKRFEKYLIYFRGRDDADLPMASCSFSQSQWNVIETGEVWAAKVARFNGKVNCRTMLPTSVIADLRNNEQVSLDLEVGK